MVVADARNLPFRANVFDYIFSNATLEHIPKNDWKKVASEVMRVSFQGFFIVTPNYWFLFEPHYLMPLPSPNQAPDRSFDRQLSSQHSGRK